MHFFECREIVRYENNKDDKKVWNKNRCNQFCHGLRIGSDISAISKIFSLCFYSSALITKLNKL